MARSKKAAATPVNVGLEPAQMQVPSMDRPSLAFAWFLDSIAIDAPPLGDDNDITIYMACNLCAERICEVEDGDTFRVLLNTALAHTCGQ